MLKRCVCILLAVLLMGVVAACGPKPKNEPLDPQKENERLMDAYTAFNDYAEHLQQAAQDAYRQIQTRLGQSNASVGGMAVVDLDDAFIRGLLRDLEGKAPITAWCWQDAGGIVRLSTQEATLGQRGGGDEIAELAMETNAVYASNNIVARVESQAALMIVIPAVKNGRAWGCIVGVIHPLRDFGPVLEPYIISPLGIMVVNTQTAIVFSDVLSEIGTNVLNDEIYKPFGDMLLAFNKIKTQSQGQTRYYYYLANTPVKDWFDVRWGTVNYFGHPWRICARTPISLDFKTIY